MPAKPAGDSKQGLIIALVCFVLLSIILGVTTYMGYDGQTAKDTAAKEAATKKSAADKERDYWKFRALQMQALAVGLPLKEEAQDLTQLQGASPSGPGQTEFVNALQNANKILTSDKGKLDTFAERVAALNSQLIATRDQLAASEANLKKAKERYDEQLATKDGEVEATRKLYLQAQATNLKDREAANKSLEEKLAQFEQLSLNYETLKKQSDSDAGTRDKIERKQKDEIRLLTEKADKLKNQLEPIDPLKFDQPKGKIISLDRRGEIAYVNIGSAQNVRPQQNLTFSVFSPGLPGHPNKDYKGSVEIIDVISPQVSKAKIIQVASPNANPLMVGDVLINPVWSPRQHEHVAIAGRIDLTGDRRNNIDEFMANLQRMGVVVDAYLDEKDNTVKGPGMTLNTTYLIIGDTPEVSGEVVGNDKRADFKLAIGVKITEMGNEAQRLGITKVPFRRFVELIGYKMPKGAGISQTFGYDSPVPAKTEPKDAKKDDPDK
ncbi:MAG TPA: hypothetical protein VGP68_06895 [Gemmataceae bacterium]|jgi:hypothetical protein|nr:hypothetical protein [Gemmataceae bacterium]